MKRFQNKFIIGIDHGYGNIKTANHCFPNGIDSSDINPILTKDILIYNGQEYQICQSHKPFLADKQDDDDYYILTLAAIAMELDDMNLTEADVIIAAGLPLKWAKNKSEAFRAYLSRNEEVCFAFRNATYSVRISDVLIYPQGFAAIAPFKSRLEGLNMIADIGNGTLSSFFIADGKVLKDEMYMDLFGTQQCTQKIRDAFFAQTGRSIKDYTIESILRTGMANIPEKDLGSSGWLPRNTSRTSTICSILTDTMKTPCCCTSSAEAAVWSGASIRGALIGSGSSTISVRLPKDMSISLRSS